MLKVLDKYKGVILLILVFVVMLDMYTNRIEQLNNIEQQSNVAYYEK